MNNIIKHSNERLMKVLLTPVISEKATFVAEKNKQTIFLVQQNTTKIEVKAAVELLFKVQVKSIQVVNRQGKLKRSGRFIGRRNRSKRVFINLKSGQEINFSEEPK